MQTYTLEKVCCVAGILVSLWLTIEVSVIGGGVFLLMSLFFSFGYVYMTPIEDRRNKAKEDEEKRERNEKWRLKEERELKENSPEMKEQREQEAQSAFEERKQELERTLSHARNQAARDLELKDLGFRIRNAEQEARDERARREEEYTALLAPLIDPQIDPLAAVYLTTQEIEQIARQAVMRIASLPSSQQSHAWEEWENDLLEKYDQLIRNEIVMCALRLRG